MRAALLGAVGAGRALGEEELAGLAGCLPTEDERRLLGPHAADPGRLNAAERLMLALMAVPQARLVFWSYPRHVHYKYNLFIEYIKFTDTGHCLFRVGLACAPPSSSRCICVNGAACVAR